MKFCYFDESGTGDEPYAVMAGIVVDGGRMKVTKTDWEALLTVLSKMVGRQVKEFHTKDFYGGKGIWKNLDGNMRARVISAILEWLKERKHKVTFSAVDKAAYRASCAQNGYLQDIGSMWCVLGLHSVLAVQKAHRTLSRLQGDSIIIFDQALQERDRITALISTFLASGMPQSQMTRSPTARESVVGLWAMNDFVNLVSVWCRVTTRTLPKHNMYAQRTVLWIRCQHA